jgi:hypothetical protein
MLKVGMKVKINPKVLKSGCGLYRRFHGKVGKIIGIGVGYGDIYPYNVSFGNEDECFLGKELIPISKLPCPFRCPFNSKGKCRKRGCKFYKDYVGGEG